MNNNNDTHTKDKDMQKKDAKASEVKHDDTKQTEKTTANNSK